MVWVLISGVLTKLWLAGENGQITGVCTYVPAWDCDYKGWEKYCFLPQACGNGTGTKLMRASLGSLNPMGLAVIYLWAFEKIFPGRRFYEKNCFPLNGDKISETTGSREIYSARYIYQPARQCHAKIE